MVKCIVCHKEIPKSLYPNTPLCSGECYQINYWDEKVKTTQNNPRIAIIRGEMYFIGSENPKSGVKGYGGRRWHILFDDGRDVTTTNLWFNGDIPDTHRDILRDNARFIKNL